MREYKSFSEFFPHYLREHAKPETRRWHYVGTVGIVGLFFWAVFTASPEWLLGIPFAAYSFAWMSHAFIERNKPATWEYPFWSALGDFRMSFLALTGELDKHLEQAGVEPENATA